MIWSVILLRSNGVARFLFFNVTQHSTRPANVTRASSLHSQSESSTLLLHQSERRTRTTCRTTDQWETDHKRVLQVDLMISRARSAESGPVIPIIGRIMGRVWLFIKGTVA